MQKYMIITESRQGPLLICNHHTLLHTISHISHLAFPPSPVLLANEAPNVVTMSNRARQRMWQSDIIQNILYNIPPIPTQPEGGVLISEVGLYTSPTNVSTGATVSTDLNR